MLALADTPHLRLDGSTRARRRHKMEQRQLRDLLDLEYHQALRERLRAMYQAQQRNPRPRRASLARLGRLLMRLGEALQKRYGEIEAAPEVPARSWGQPV